MSMSTSVQGLVDVNIWWINDFAYPSVSTYSGGSPPPHVHMVVRLSNPRPASRELLRCLL